MATAGLAVFLRTLQKKAWFMGIATLVALAEAAGFALRIVMLYNPMRGYYIAMQCLLIIPPSFLALVGGPFPAVSLTLSPAI